MFASIVIASVPSLGFAQSRFAWSDADRAQIARLEKKAKKNGALFVVSGEVFEARLPTRAAAAEFTHYFERLAQTVRPLLDTRELNPIRVGIAVYTSDAAWPAEASGRLFRCDVQSGKTIPGGGTKNPIAAIDLWIAPSIASEALEVASIPQRELVSSGVRALFVRLAGHKSPPWLVQGMTQVAAAWSPVGEDGRRGSAAFGPMPASSRVARALANRDPLDILMPILEHENASAPAADGASAELVFESFYRFLLEHDQGRKLFVQVCEDVSHGKVIELDRKRIQKLIPAWRTWAGVPDAAAESGGTPRERGN